MSKWKPKEVFAKVVCVGARSGIVAALYLAAFLAALQLAAVLPEPWSAVGITALVLVAGLALRGKWPGREFRLESVGLGYQPDGPANLQPSRRASLASRHSSAVPASFRRGLGLPLSSPGPCERLRESAGGVGEERCLRHRAGATTRHPRNGCTAQQPWLLYRNHPEISDLQNLQRCRAPEVPICELVENKERRLKEKTGARRTSAHLAIPTNAKNFPSAPAAVKDVPR